MATLTQTATRIAPPSAGAGAHLTLQLQTPQQSTLFDEQGSFAFARIYDNICLVQTATPTSTQSSKASLAPATIALPVAVAVFRHEFGTMFRYAHRATFPARDVQLLAALDADTVLCERETGVVFLTREMTDQLLRWSAPRVRRRY